MIRTIDLRGQHLEAGDLSSRLPRAEVDVDVAIERVRPILHRVRTEGAAALGDLAEQFDGVRPAQLRVPAEAITAAEAALAPDLKGAIVEAIRRARAAHSAQLPEPATTELGPGALVHQRWVPVQRVGLYVPGGLAAYPSSVIMNAVAAQVAGTGSIALASPPQKDNDGLPNPTVLAACALLGIEEVYAVGGAHAIGMFAYGVNTRTDGVTDSANSCAPVDVVTGPGNIYVAAAKRAVLGVVGIDSEAGTTEIGILADDSADPAWVAADLISQAEHDPAAASVLVTASAELADAVREALEVQVPAAKHSERIATALGGPQSAIVLVDDLEAGIEVVDAYAAEHLEIHTADAAEIADRIHNAGAIFVGPYSPVPLGDYIAGSNHVLPTGGTARFASGLGVQAFLKSVQVVDYTAEALAEVTDALSVFADSEDLPAHAYAARIRRGE